MGHLSLTAEYGLLLDAIAPLETYRADYRGWDDRRWGQTLRTADWHRLSPTLFSHLESRADDAVPGAVRSALERTYLANAARSMFIADALAQVLGALGNADVPAMLLKGAALVETVYPDAANREMLDVDILVPVERIPAANAALAALGYEPEPAPEGADGSSVQWQLGDLHAPALVGDEQVVAVELHHHITLAGEGTRFDIDDLWRRARSSSKGRHLLPSPEDLLIHVCLHFTRNRLGGSYRRRHTGGALAQIGDIARLLEAESVNWEALIGAARTYGLGARVFLALFAASELGVEIPEAPLRELTPMGFDPALGRRLVALRVVRDGDHMPVRTLRWMFAPSREVLSRGWSADPTATLSLARAYMRRARAQAPLARSALRRPWSYVQDQRLNSQIHALEGRR